MPASATPLATLTEATLKDETDLDGGSYTCEQIAAGDGYFLTARDREKFITNSVIFFGTVYTVSFKPLISSNPCEAGGGSTLYGIDLFCGLGIFPTGTTGVTKRTIDIGDGISNRPRVSVGPVNTDVDPNCTGSDCDPTCKNMVVVITSDGNAYTDSPDASCPSGIRVNSWRDF